jgi:hypothetical protein
MVRKAVAPWRRFRGAHRCALRGVIIQGVVDSGLAQNVDWRGHRLLFSRFVMLENLEIRMRAIGDDVIKPIPFSELSVLRSSRAA